jgi:hypothetical protein
MLGPEIVSWCRADEGILEEKLAAVGPVTDSGVVDQGGRFGPEELTGPGQLIIGSGAGRAH